MALAGALKWSRVFFFFSGGQGLKWRARWDLEGGRGGFGMGGGWSAQACLIPTVWQALSWWRAAVVCIPPAGTISSTKRSKPCTLRLWLEAEVSLHNYTDVCLTVKWYSVEVHLFTFRNRRVFFSSRNGFFLWPLAEFLSLLKILLNKQQSK